MLSIKKTIVAKVEHTCGICDSKICIGSSFWTTTRCDAGYPKFYTKTKVCEACYDKSFKALPEWAQWQIRELRNKVARLELEKTKASK